MLSDTTPDARRFYYRRLAEMTPAERVEIAMQLTAAADQLLRASIGRRHPEAEGPEFEYHVLCARYGRAVADKVHPR